MNHDEQLHKELVDKMRPRIAELVEEAIRTNGVIVISDQSYALHCAGFPAPGKLVGTPVVNVASLWAVVGLLTLMDAGALVKLLVTRQPRVVTFANTSVAVVTFRSMPVSSTVGQA